MTKENALMGDRDVTQRRLTNQNVVAADLCNVFFFDGEQVVLPEELENAALDSSYLTNDAVLSELRRDVAKLWKEGGVVFAFFGIESQTAIDPSMALRMIAYDGLAYREQIGRDKKGPFYPVFSLVLYFGKRPWTENQSLGESVVFPLKGREKLMRFFNDYRAWVFDISRLTLEQVQMFRSDFRGIAAFFYKERHPDAPADLLNMACKDTQSVVLFLEAYTGHRIPTEVLDRIQKEKGEVTMNDLAEEFSSKYIAIGEQRGERRGFELGEQRGIELGERRANQRNEENLRRSARRFLSHGVSLEDIADSFGIPLETAQEWLREDSGQ